MNISNPFFSPQLGGEVSRLNRGIQALIHRGEFHYLYEEYILANKHFQAATKLAIENEQYMLGATSSVLFEHTSKLIYEKDETYFEVFKSSTLLKELVSKLSSPKFMTAANLILKLVNSAPKRSRKNDPTIQSYKLQHLALQDVFGNIKNLMFEHNKSVSGDDMLLDPFSNFLKNVFQNLSKTIEETTGKKIELDDSIWNNPKSFKITTEDLKDPERQIDFEMSYRDYLRGLKQSGLWYLHFKETSENHHYELLGKERRITVLPKCENINEIGLRLLLGANEENLMVGVSQKDHIPMLFKLESRSIDFFRLHGSFIFNPIEEILDYKKRDEKVINFFQKLWNLTFGAKILEVYLEDGTINHSFNDLNETLHQYLQNEKIQKLRIIPQSMFYTLPLNAACFVSEGILKHAIEFYDIRYLPPWVIENNNKRKGYIEHSFLISSKGIEESNLPFATLEGRLGSSFCQENFFITDSGVEHSTNIDDFNINNKVFVDKIKYLFQNSKKISLITHGNAGIGKETNYVKLNNGEETVRIDYKFISTLNIPKSSIVILNSCYSTAANPGTEVEDYNLPLSFLSKGASYVICNALPINDFDGFRIHSRVNELMNNNDERDFPDVFRSVLLEGLKKQLPYYDSIINDRSLSKIMRLRKHRENHQLITWYPYILWENHES